MGVIAEWWWSCDQCSESGEEPWGDQEAAARELAQHMAEVHPEQEGAGTDA